MDHFRFVESTLNLDCKEMVGQVRGECVFETCKINRQGGSMELRKRVRWFLSLTGKNCLHIGNLMYVFRSGPEKKFPLF